MTKEAAEALVSHIEEMIKWKVRDMHPDASCGDYIALQETKTELTTFLMENN